MLFKQFFCDLIFKVMHLNVSIITLIIVLPHISTTIHSSRLATIPDFLVHFELSLHL